MDEIYDLSRIDRWFLYNIKQIINLEEEIAHYGGEGEIPVELLRKAKQYGFSDIQLARLLNKDEDFVYNLRKKKNVLPAFKQVDTCGAEFEAYTPYYYSTYESESENCF